MSITSYDIFLSHSGAQKTFVEQLYRELRQIGRYSVFFDKESIRHGEQISPIVLQHAKMCKLNVAVLSKEYFTRSRHPMLELAASFTAAKDGKGVPCILPVFLALKPEHAKDDENQREWIKKWEQWRLNEIMSKSRKEIHICIEVWEEALCMLLDTRGPIYFPNENKKDPAIFLKKVARIIVEKLDEILIKSRVKTMLLDNMGAEGVQQLYKDTGKSESVPASDVIKNGGAHEQNHVGLRRKTQHFLEQLSLLITELEDEIAKSSSRIEDLLKLLQGRRDCSERLITELDDEVKEDNANSSSRIEDLPKVDRSCFHTRATPHRNQQDYSWKWAHPVSHEDWFFVGNDQYLGFQLHYGQGIDRNQNIQSNQVHRSSYYIGSTLIKEVY
ncbi:hypothetical protein KC19_6G029600 [Ceratodon purpureus]|uniref:ADP-ribosyl cyclase/cyclic ADP-ribose hydrolase n=1 Tax=Ceratodon purpureus TaxID=3225 RepID=A0A8T0HEL5_CERPU|nr:hypothetical protein KC19_6G029600 [Ceratodon purpureus]